MANRSIIEQTFNYIYFVFEFDFCNRSEMRALYNCLRQAWEWGHPPVKDDGKDEAPARQRPASFSFTETHQ